MRKRYKHGALLLLLLISHGAQAMQVDVDLSIHQILSRLYRGMFGGETVEEKKDELDRKMRKNAPAKELRELAAEIQLLDPSFVKKFSVFAYFQANLKNLPKKPTGLFDEKSGTCMTPGAAELLGVKLLSTDKKKKADEPDIIICFKKWYESSANPKKHKRDGRASQKNVKKRKKNVGAMVPLVAGLTLGGE